MSTIAASGLTMKRLASYMSRRCELGGFWATMHVPSNPKTSQPSQTFGCSMTRRKKSWSSSMGTPRLICGGDHCTKSMPHTCVTLICPIGSPVFFGGNVFRATGLR